MKLIYHVIPGLRTGGAEAALVKYVLHEKDFEHIVISLTPGGANAKILRDMCKQVIELNLKNPLGFIKGLFWLVRHFYKKKRVIIIGWMYIGELLGTLCSIMCKESKLVWYVHHASFNFVGARKYLNKYYYILLLNSLITKFFVDKILFVSTAGMRFHEKFGYDPSKGIVVVNGYDTNKFKISLGMSQSVDLRVNDTLVIGHVGRWHPDKDYDTFMKCISHFKSTYRKKFVVSMYGSGLDPNNTEISALVERYGISDNVILNGVVNDIETVYPHFDLLLLSSKTEAFPNAICEAMLCGIYCVTTDCGDASLIVQDDDLVCSTGDFVALSRNLKRAALRLQSRDVYGQKRLVREKVLKYSLVNQITKIKGILNE